MEFVEWNPGLMGFPRKLILVDDTWSHLSATMELQAAYIVFPGMNQSQSYLVFIIIHIPLPLKKSS